MIKITVLLFLLFISGAIYSQVLNKKEIFKLYNWKEIKYDSIIELDYKRQFFSSKDSVTVNMIFKNKEMEVKRAYLKNDSIYTPEGWVLIFKYKYNFNSNSDSLSSIYIDTLINIKYNFKDKELGSSYSKNFSYVGYKPLNYFNEQYKLGGTYVNFNDQDNLFSISIGKIDSNLNSLSQKMVIENKMLKYTYTVGWLNIEIDYSIENYVEREIQLFKKMEVLSGYRVYFDPMKFPGYIVKQKEFLPYIKFGDDALDAIFVSHARKKPKAIMFNEGKLYNDLLKLIQQCPPECKEYGYIDIPLSEELFFDIENNKLTFNEKYDKNLLKRLLVKLNESFD